jgi:hypothetical protein
LIVTGAEAGEVQPAEFETVNVYVPLSSPVIVAVVPVPEVLTEPGLRVIIHDPEEGRPDRATDPDEEVQVGCVTEPVTACAGTGLTASANDAVAALQGSPTGLFVVTVIVTVLPTS